MIISINKKINITIICALIALTGCTKEEQTIATSQAQSQISFNSFTEWCEQKSTLPKEMKHTVEVLLEKSGTQDCQQANKILNNFTELDIRGSKISNLKPLSGFTNLTKLYLGYNNKISDLEPLSNLTNLTSLRLEQNQINDIKPLVNLTKLTWLELTRNNISDVEALATLTNLTTLRIEENQISDLKPLANLTNLTRLSLG
ncbi:MAG: leucine-rich repeat domain-containing protein, partial [Cyanobacteria bacterium P01_A01_bin.68]